MDAKECFINVHDHGTAIDEQKRRVKCNYCAKVVSGFNRLKCHLGGLRGDVVPCDKVSTDVKELMRKNLLEKKIGNLNKEVGDLYHPNLPWKRKWCCPEKGTDQKNMKAAKTSQSEKAEPVKMDLRSENIDVTSVVSSKESMGLQEAIVLDDSPLGPVEECISRFFYETGIDFSAVESPSFRKMMDTVLEVGKKGCKIPSRQELEGRIFHHEVQQVQLYVKEMRESWARTGCSILLDGWMDGKGRDLINILVDCPTGAIYLDSFDISASLKNTDGLRFLLQEVLEDIGLANVVQVVTYSTSPCLEAVGKQLMSKHRTLFWTVSASYCIEVILEKISMMDTIKMVLEKAKTIMDFICSHGAVSRLVRAHTGGRDLAKPSKIRSIEPFLTLENLVSEKESLINVFVSSNWIVTAGLTSREGKTITDLVGDCSFWAGATMVLKAATPLLRVLEFINEGGKHQLGYIYETMDQVKETIKEEFKSKKSQYMPFWREIDQVWNSCLHSPLHSAGYFLNPALFYSSDFYTDPEVASGLLCCIVRMAENQHVQDLITLQVDEYRGPSGDFSKGSAIDRRSNASPVCWWSMYGGHCPELQRFAVRILSQTCNGASKYNLKRSLAEHLLEKGRNHAEQQRLRDLAFVHYNLQLQNAGSGSTQHLI